LVHLTKSQLIRKNKKCIFSYLLIKPV